jgi:hypothetical protein
MHPAQSLALLVGLFCTFSGFAEEEFEQVLGARGGTVQTPIRVSELADSRIIVSPKAVGNQTTFSISTSLDHCPDFPKNLVDIASPHTFLPKLKFDRDVVLRIGIPETYRSRLGVKKNSSPLSSRKLFSKLQIWSHSKERGWYRISHFVRGPNYIEISTREIMGSCFTPSIPI